MSIADIDMVGDGVRTPASEVVECTPRKSARLEEKDVVDQMNKYYTIIMDAVTSDRENDNKNANDKVKNDDNLNVSPSIQNSNANNSVNNVNLNSPVTLQILTLQLMI